jgi:hypothetical protein
MIAFKVKFTCANLVAAYFQYYYHWSFCDYAKIEPSFYSIITSCKRITNFFMVLTLLHIIIIFSIAGCTKMNTNLKYVQVRNHFLYKAHHFDRHHHKKKTCLLHFTNKSSTGLRKRNVPKLVQQYLCIFNVP